MSSAQWIDDARALSITDAATRLGVALAGRNGLACPACGATRRSSSDRRSTSATYGARGWRCWSCTAAGDALDLVSYRLTGSKLTADRDQLATVRAWLVDQGITTEDTRPHRPHLRAVPAEPTPSVTYPPVDEVATFWDGARPVTDDPQVLSWIGRRFGVFADDLIARIVHYDAARAIPTAGSTPTWARFGGQTWRQAGYRLLLPLCDASGQMRSLRGRYVGTGPTPKALPAAGYSCGGLVLACDRARALLSGAPLPLPEGVLPSLVVLEGETDWLAWLSQRADDTDPALIAVYSGAWTPEYTAALPWGTKVHIRTDDDTAGHRYADAIVADCRKRRDLTITRGGVQ
jgi:hypothetical protein